MIEPKVSLVGAGPGSVDLITLRGLRVLQQADVILYDALINPSLLEGIDSRIPRINVGKRCGKHSHGQDSINRMLVEKAYEYGHVVRLKGGDPFVFGRGSEEMEYVTSFGIPITIVPGVSSALAVPAGQGIPLTQRGTSSSFWVMTATKKEGTFCADLGLAAQSSATLVILMGIRKCAEIAQEILKHRSGTTPVAIIQNGTMEGEHCVVGSLDQMGKLAQQLHPSHPGIIVIGEVVAGHPALYGEEIQRMLHSHL
jgi:uroporphyrin-III C-methyltransferase